MRLLPSGKERASACIALQTRAGKASLCTLPPDRHHSWVIGRLINSVKLRLKESVVSSGSADMILPSNLTTVVHVATNDRSGVFAEAYGRLNI